jgi:hypothetical protein
MKVRIHIEANSYNYDMTVPCYELHSSIVVSSARFCKRRVLVHTEYSSLEKHTPACWSVSVARGRNLQPTLPYWSKFSSYLPQRPLTLWMARKGWPLCRQHATAQNFRSKI